MSRIFSFSSCGFLLGLLACLVMTSTSEAQQTSLQNWAPAPSLPGELPPHGQPFLSLLDDVTIESPREEDYFSFVAQCQLNAPIEVPTQTKACSSHSGPHLLSEDDESEWATLLTYTCNDKTCGECSTLVFTNSPPSHGALIVDATLETNSHSHSPLACCNADSCPSCIGKTIKDESESYCQQVSKLLATTINSSQASFEAKSEAIESAMQMVADKTLADAQQQISEIESAHQKQIDELREQLLAAKDQSESMDQVLAWLRPIYTNQNRNFEQLQQLAGLSEELQQQNPIPVDRFNDQEKESCYVSNPNPVFDRTLLPSNVRLASKALAENRAAEISRLKQEIELINARLAKLVKQPVQPATHLEPVYVPNQELVPILNTPERHSFKKLELAPPLKRLR